MLESLTFYATTFVRQQYTFKHYCSIVAIETSVNTPVKRWHTFRDTETTLKKDKFSILNVTIALEQKVLKVDDYKHKLRGLLWDRF